MRTITGRRTGWLLGACGAAVLAAGVANAAPSLLTTTERPGSILIFPKVVRDGTRDTVIQISNTGNMLDNVRCFYLDGRSCLVTDFDLVLTKQQPTVWRVGDGRPISSKDGFSPGTVPPRPFGFEGALICTEVQPDFSDVNVRNALKGEATLEPLGTGNRDLSKYNAIAIQGGSGGSDNVLTLDGSEYAGCPAANVVNFLPDTANVVPIENLGDAGHCVSAGSDTGSGCNVAADCDPGTCPPATCNCSSGLSSTFTVVTFVPCGLDLQNATGSSFSVDLEATVNDDGSKVDRSGKIDYTNACWGSFELGKIPVGLPLRSPLMSLTGQYASVRMTSSGVPLVAVAESFYADSLQNTASAADNAHIEGSVTSPAPAITLEAP